MCSICRDCGLGFSTYKGLAIHRSHCSSRTHTTYVEPILQGPSDSFPGMERTEERTMPQANFPRQEEQENDELFHFMQAYGALDINHQNTEDVSTDPTTDNEEDSKSEDEFE